MSISVYEKYADINRKDIEHRHEVLLCKPEGPKSFPILIGRKIFHKDVTYYYVQGGEVKRGPTWRWGNQDCTTPEADGVPVIGHITELSINASASYNWEWIAVRWHHNNIAGNHYNYPVSDHKDPLKISASLDIVPANPIYSVYKYQSLRRLPNVVAIGTSRFLKYKNQFVEMEIRSSTARDIIDHELYPRLKYLFDA